MQQGIDNKEIGGGDAQSLALYFQGIMDMHIMAKSNRPETRLMPELADGQRIRGQSSPVQAGASGWAGRPTLPRSPSFTPGRAGTGLLMCGEPLTTKRSGLAAHAPA